MLLRILMGWHMIDMTYVALNVNTSGKMTPLLVVTPERQQPTGTAGEEKRPHFDDLPKEVRLDRALISRTGVERTVPSRLLSGLILSRFKFREKTQKIMSRPVPTLPDNGRSCTVPFIPLTALGTAAVY